MKWIKDNAATVVTWVLLALAAASTVGAHANSFESVKKSVEDISAKVDSHDSILGTMGSDVQVLKSTQNEIKAEVKVFRAAMTDLHRVVARLEAVVGVLKKGSK